MEPIWLAVAGASLGSTVRAVADKATQPFSAALDAAQDLLDKEEQPEVATTQRARTSNPHQRLLQEMLTGKPLLEDEVDLNLGDIRYQADALQQELEQHIERVLKAAGIDFQGKVQLRTSPEDGSLEVVGDTPHRAAIERVLSDDQTLSADFRRLSALRSLVRAADDHSEFADAYRLDPQQAVNDFAALFAEEEEVLLVASEFLTELRFE